MATLALTQAKFFIDGYQIDADLNKIDVTVSSAALDTTTFGASFVTRIGGLKTATVMADGYVDLGSSQSDGVLFNAIGGSADVVTVFPNGITALSTAAGSGYGLNKVDSKYSPTGDIGKVFAFSYEAQGAGPLLRAVVLQDFTSAALSSGTTNGSFVQMPTVSTCEALYAGLHVTGVSTGLATSVTVLVQQASSSNGGGATTRGTFSAASCRQAQYLTPVKSNSLSTDQPFWRATFTVSTGGSSGATANGIAWMSLQS